MADAAEPVVEGVSNETHQALKTEADKLREQLAVLRAKQEVVDSQKREELLGLKSDVSDFVSDIAGDAEFKPYTAQLQPMCRWAAEIEKGESVDTNLSLSRLISCASAKFKRTREEASQLGAKSDELASTYKALEETKADRDAKAHRITELEGLVAERTDAAEKLQAELAKAGALSEKFDFSNKSARENVAGGSSSSPVAMASASSSAMPAVGDALFSFLSGSSSGAMGGLRVTPSSTSHAFLGGSGDGGVAAAIAATSY